MAKFEFDMADVEKFMDSLEFASEDLFSEMLDAKGAVIEKAQRQAALKFKQHTGNLAKSFELNKTLKKDKNGAYYKNVSPKGIHHKTKKGNVNNAEVAFVLNYGAPRRNLKATHFIDSANDNSAQAAFDAAQTVFEKSQI